MAKAYCKKCKYLQAGYVCMAEVLIEDTWLKQEKRYENPAVKNKNNNCKDYVPK